MARQNKTKPTCVSVSAFIDSIDNDIRRRDAGKALEMMQRITAEPPVMWGASIVGFGTYHYKYESRHEGDFMLTGFAPRKSAMVLYIMGGVPHTDALFAKLGKYRLGKACLYINKFEDVDLEILEQIIAKSVAYMRETYH